MLSYRLDGDILEVIESVHGWSKTKVTYWYYDIKQWKVSSHGKQFDVPDRAMVPDAIEWVKKYYLKHAM